MIYVSKDWILRPYKFSKKHKMSLRSLSTAYQVTAKSDAAAILSRLGDCKLVFGFYKMNALKPQPTK